MKLDTESVRSTTVACNKKSDRVAWWLRISYVHTTHHTPHTTHHTLSNTNKTTCMNPAVPPAVEYCSYFLIWGPGAVTDPAQLSRTNCAVLCMILLTACCLLLNKEGSLSVLDWDLPCAAKYLSDLYLAGNISADWTDGGLNLLRSTGPVQPPTWILLSSREEEEEGEDKVQGRVSCYVIRSILTWSSTTSPSLSPLSHSWLHKHEIASSFLDTPDLAMSACKCLNQIN